MVSTLLILGPCSSTHIRASVTETGQRPPVRLYFPTTGTVISDAVFIQVYAKLPKALPPLIEASVDGKRWSIPEAPLLNHEPNQYTMLLPIRQVKGPSLFVRARAPGAPVQSASVSRVRIDHLPVIVATYQFSKGSRAYLLDASQSRAQSPGNKIRSARWVFADGTVLNGLRVKKLPPKKFGRLPGYVVVRDGLGIVNQLHFRLPSLKEVELRTRGRVPPTEKCVCESLKFKTDGNSTLDPGRPLGKLDYAVGEKIPLNHSGHAAKVVFLYVSFEVEAKVKYVEGEKKACPESQLIMQTIKNAKDDNIKKVDPANPAGPKKEYPFVDPPKDSDFGLDGYTAPYKGTINKHGADGKMTGSVDDADAPTIDVKKHSEDGTTITWYDAPGAEVPAKYGVNKSGIHFKARYRATVESCTKTLKIEWDIDKEGKVTSFNVKEE